MTHLKFRRSWRSGEDAQDLLCSEDQLRCQLTIDGRDLGTKFFLESGSVISGSDMGPLVGRQRVAGGYGANKSLVARRNDGTAKDLAQIGRISDLNLALDEGVRAPPFFSSE